MAAAAPAAEPAPAGTNNAEALWFNDELVDTLMLLDYETRFCNRELKPISRAFFAYPAVNTAHQFKYFTQLVVWGLSLAPGHAKADWDEYDDPNTVVQSMLVILKDMGIQGCNAVPAKLKQAHGDSVCAVLHGLFKEVLRNTHQWDLPKYPDEGLADEAEVDSDAEVHSVGEDEMPGADGEEDDLMYQEDAVKKPEENSQDDDHQVIQNNIDPTVWKLEVERVVPKLKVTMPNDSKEWRTHLSQTRGYKQVIETQFPAAKAQLEKLSKELSGALQKIRDKENFINTTFDHRNHQFSIQQEEMTTVQSQYTGLNEVVMNLQIELKNLSEEMEVVKNEMEERSSTVTDTAPIVKMKDAFKRLRADTRTLEVKIGVVSHTLMQAKLRQRPQDNQKREGMYNGGGNQSDGYDDNE
jgi:estrogen-related receptor beta like 1